MHRSILVLSAMFAPLAAEAAAPTVVPITGFLTDDTGAPVDGPVDMRVRLYTTSTGGTATFDEDLIDVPVTNGQFTVYINSAEQSTSFLSLFDTNSQLYVGLAINGVTEMTPRIAVGSAPYAAYAQYCDDATTLNGDDFADVRRTGDLIDWTDLDVTSLPAGLVDGDQDTTYAAGTGLALAGTTFSVTASYVEGLAMTAAYDTPSELTAALVGQYLPNISCPVGNTVKSDGAGGWSCAKGTDLALDEAVIDGLVSNNGFATTTSVAAIGTAGTANNPARSCRSLRGHTPALPSGDYQVSPIWIDPALDAAQITEYCDLTTDGGGWTRCLTWETRKNGTGTDFFRRTIDTAQGSTAGKNLPATLANSCNRPWPVVEYRLQTFLDGNLRSSTRFRTGPMAFSSGSHDAYTVLGNSGTVSYPFVCFNGTGATVAGCGGTGGYGTKSLYTSGATFVDGTTTTTSGYNYIYVEGTGQHPLSGNQWGSFTSNEVVLWVRAD